MNRRAVRLLLCLLTVTLAVAPLRGLMAFTLLPDAGAMTHCAMMEEGMHGAADEADPRPDHAGKHCPACKQDCPQERCAAHCLTLMQAFTALPGVVLPAVMESGRVAPDTAAAALAGRTLPPLYRPPIPFA